MAAVLLIFATLLIVTGHYLTMEPEHGIPMDRNASDTDVTCEEAQKHAGEIKVGMTDEQVIELIGKPGVIDGDVWVYNFFECTKPVVGSQIIIGIALVFKDRSVTKIDYATICATGPGH